MHGKCFSRVNNMVVNQSCRIGKIFRTAYISGIKIRLKRTDFVFTAWRQIFRHRRFLNRNICFDTYGIAAFCLFHCLLNLGRRTVNIDGRTLFCIGVNKRTVFPFYFGIFCFRTFLFALLINKGADFFLFCIIFQFIYKWSCSNLPDFCIIGKRIPVLANLHCFRNHITNFTVVA